ncbi:MAG: chemotaxis protein CheA [Planctomycetaceae bacterium]
MGEEFDFSAGRPSDEMAQYLQMYLDETAEQLDGLVESLLVLETQPADAAQLNEAFRLIHSIKGSSAMMGLDAITVLTHHLENHFERVRSGAAELDQTSMGLILRCVDFLRECNSRLRGGASLGSAPDLLDELNALVAPAGSPAPPPVGATQNSLPPAEHIATPSTAERAEFDEPEPSSQEPPSRPLALAQMFRIAVQFEPNLALADLKAELVLARLAEIGTIGQTRPDRSEIAAGGDLRKLQVLMQSDHTMVELRAAADVDGVESIEVDEGAVAFAVLPTERTPISDFRPAAAGDSYAANVDEDEQILAVETSGMVPDAVPAAESLLSARKAASAAASPGSAETRARVVETVRVDIERLDRLMNLTGELVVNKARFVQIARQMSPAFRKSSVSGRARAFSDSMRRAVQLLKNHAGRGEGAAAIDWNAQFHGLESEIEALEEQARLWEQSRRYFGQITEAIDHMSRVSDNLQRGVLDTRMVPVAPLFNRFKRVVRDIALELDKKVNLEIRGEKTELDKRMIDELGDPLVHLVRNAIDHGIEPADVRKERGKPAIGTIWLEAAHSGNNVFISVRDDGGGIPVEKVRRQIAERGLAPAATVDALTEREVIDFIWHPGFSTAERVSDISGRGVGMDIVKTRIADLNGTIDIRHEPGSGTTFTIRLPLTLAIIRSLLFRLRHGVFAVPIDNVREIVSVPVDQIVSIHGRQTFEVRGEFIPLVDLDDVFEWHAGAEAGSGRSATEAKRLKVVILHSGNRTMGLTVDELQGSQDIVIKSLAENFIPIAGLSGASILGDGSVCLLLDAGALIDLTTSTRRERP